ncbi:hypothetical protein AALP_AA5G230300 [Arabis alpina]|uniref:Uncharacterized protein n=1 Tax=Arabis alpina TaxID=50452 RepID=A0A087GYW1_ARAAL|nr:hypothetical protein AALP_AA5G230300 [Arabis alpina]
MTKTTPDDAYVDVLRRRSGNYQPSPWNHRSLLSIDSKYAEEDKVITRDLLKNKVRKMLDNEKESFLEQLELIDDLQKLGVSYHFELEINNILTDIYQENVRNVSKEEDTHAMALEFRLLRQHGFDVSEDIFDVIIEKIKRNTFKTYDIKSIITLYEASYLSTKSDTKLREVIRTFAVEQIRKFIDSVHDDDTYNTEMAIHALEMPYHWRMRRLETRWYIDVYEKKHDMNLVLIDFAKIDFNIVQTAHQEDLKYVSSWWKGTCLSKQLPFVRDRIVENYFWTVGLIYEPQFGYIRRIMAIINALVTTIDDIYDIYGTLEELELFTAMVEKWDVNRLDELPEYMKLCFLILFNEINGIGCDVLKHKNIDVIPLLRKSWTDLCKAYLVEAKCLESLSQHRQNVVRCSATVLRLANDLGTSPDELARGDVLKSVQCYMHETGASEEKARAHVHQMISDTWDEMNYEAKTARSSSLLPLPQGFVEASMNLARMSQCMYQFGDGHGFPDKAKTVDRVMSLLVNPIPLD